MMPAHQRTREYGSTGGFTLLELIAVLFLLAVFATLVIVRINPGSLADAEARAAARRISLDLMVARREAIATGDNFVVEFVANASPVSYRVKRRATDGSLSDASSARALHPEVKLSVSPDNPEFTFEGDALNSYAIQVRGPRQTWEVQVQQVGAIVRVNQL